MYFLFFLFARVCGSFLGGFFLGGREGCFPLNHLHVFTTRFADQVKWYDYILFLLFVLEFH